MEDHQYKALELTIRSSGGLDAYLVDCMITVKESELENLRASKQVMNTHDDLIHIYLESMLDRRVRLKQRLERHLDILVLLDRAEKVSYVLDAVIDEHGNVEFAIEDIFEIARTQKKYDAELYQEPTKWWQKFFK